MTIAVTGASGFVGTNIRKYFYNRGYEIKSIPREALYDLEKLQKELESVNIIIHTSGFPITKRWTARNRKKIFDSRFITTLNISKAIKNLKNPPELIISSSAIGIYNNIHYHDEYSTDYSDDFLGKVCAAWEKPITNLNTEKTRTVITRLGVVIGSGGVLKKLYPVFRLGLGGQIGDGTYSMPFIHIDDLLKFHELAINNKSVEGIYNLVTPNIIKNKEFTNAFANALSKKAFMKIPPFALNLLFGKGLMSVISSPVVIPKRLLGLNFKFEKDKIEDAIKSSINNMN